jgi:hypothetical protein
MGFLTALWIPILLSAVFVFAVSSLIHMMLQYHKNDFKKLPNEDAVMDALRKFDIPEGDYLMPCAGTAKAMRSQEFIQKWTKGPVAMMTFMKSGTHKMGQSLTLWFLYSVVVNIFAAYICDRALGPGANYLKVLRFVGCSAFMGYSFALCQNSIWYKRNWAATIRTMFDGLIYALVTAGTFGWLWPR